MSDAELSWLVGSSLAGVEAEESGRWVFTFAGGGAVMVGIAQGGGSSAGSNRSGSEISGTVILYISTDGDGY